MQACRRFRPSQLVPAIAQVSASLGEPPYPNRLKVALPPWGLAVAARESILYGNEHRQSVSEISIAALMRRFFESDALPALKPGDRGFLLSVMTAVTYEQFPWQESIYQELARSHAMLIGSLDHVDLEVLSRSALQELLGAPLGEAIGATFVLQVGAYQNNGVYNSRWLDQDNFKDVLQLYPRSAIEAAASRLTATRDEFRADFAENSHGDKRVARYDYNPLVRTPFVDMGDGTVVTPAPRLIMRTVTPGGLYYPGLNRYGPAFARDLGLLFEHYVGRNLRLIDGADVHQEIVYGPNRDRKSVDWFVVLPRLTILVECKLKRLGLPARAGNVVLNDDMEKSVRKAHGQLARSVEQLEIEATEFRHIPTDRPLLGVIISAEPSYTGAAYLVEEHLASIISSRFGEIPVAALSAREVEMLVTFGADVEQLLLDRLHTYASGTAFSVSGLWAEARGANVILEDAWDSYPFPRSDQAS